MILPAAPLAVPHNVAPLVSSPWQAHVPSLQSLFTSGEPVSPEASSPAAVGLNTKVPGLQSIAGAAEIRSWVEAVVPTPQIEAAYRQLAPKLTEFARSGESGDSFVLAQIPSSFQELQSRTTEGGNPMVGPERQALYKVMYAFIVTAQENGVPIDLRPEYVASVNAAFIKSYLGAEGVAPQEATSIVRKISQGYLQEPSLSVHTFNGKALVRVTTLPDPVEIVLPPSQQPRVKVLPNQNPTRLPLLPAASAQGIADNALGRISTIAMIVKPDSVETAFGAISAFPDREFTLIYNPNHWSAKGIPDFPKYLQNELSRRGVIGVDVRFDVNNILPVHGPEWLRDPAFKGRQYSGKPVVYTTSDGSETGKVSWAGNAEARDPRIDVNGGAFRAVGDTVFFNVPQLKKAISEARRWREVEVSFPDELHLAPIQLLVGSKPVSSHVVEHLAENNRAALDALAQRGTETLNDIDQLLKDVPSEEGKKRVLAAAYVSSFIFPYQGPDLSQFVERRVREIKPVVVAGDEVLPKESTDAEVGAAVKRAYGKLFGRKVVVVGEGLPASAFPHNGHSHVDMYIQFVPTGVRPDGSTIIAVVMPSIKEAGKILAALSPQERDVIEQQMNQEARNATRSIRELPSTAREAARSILFHDMHDVLNDYVNITQSNPEIELLSHQLDAIAQWFESQGYHVERVPGLVRFTNADKQATIFPTQGDTSKPPTGETNISSRKALDGNDYSLTPANGLAEVLIDESGTQMPIVYLPSFGIQKFDEIITERYNKIGYFVVFVPGFIETSIGAALLDCYTNETRVLGTPRGPSPSYLRPSSSGRKNSAYYQF
jgi:hypothetical protein